MDSSSSVAVITGSEIFLTITALPESDAATSLVLKAFDSKTRRIDSATAAPSIMAPSTMLSGGIGSVPKAATRKPFPTAFSSTALTALEPMSSPTTDRLFLNKEKFITLARLGGARPVAPLPADTVTKLAVWRAADHSSVVQ